MANFPNPHMIYDKVGQSNQVISQYGILLPQGFDKATTTIWIEYFFRNNGKYFLDKAVEDSGPGPVIDHYVDILDSKVGVQFELESHEQEARLDNLMLTIPYDRYPYRIFHKIFPPDDENAKRGFLHRRSQIQHEYFKMSQRRDYVPREVSGLHGGPSSSPQYQQPCQAP